MGSFKIDLETLVMEESVKPPIQSDWLELNEITDTLIGNSINICQYLPIPEKKTMILVKFFSKIDESIRLKGWTFLYIAKNGEIETGRWKLPLYLPPVNKIVNDKSHKQIWDYAYIYISIGDMQYPDMFEAYSEHIQHHNNTKELNFYKNWQTKMDAKKLRVKEMVETLKDDLLQVQTFVDNEQKLIESLQDKERKTTEDMLCEIVKVIEKKKDKTLYHLRNRIKELLSTIEALNSDERDFDELECIKRIGIRVTINWIEKIKTKKSIKVYMSVVNENGVILDDLQNRANYNTPIINDFMDEQSNIKAMENNSIFDIEIDEIFYVLKHIELFLKKFGDKIKLFLLFKVFEADGDSRLDNIEDKRTILDNYVFKEKLNLIGACIFELKIKNLSSNVGRYKQELFKSLGDDFPPFNPKEKIFTKLDFTVETFEYDKENMDNYVLRIKKRKKKKTDDDLFTDKRPFIINEKTQYTEKAFEKGSGIDIYIDGARYLPNSTTVTKIIFRVVDSNLNDAIAPSSKISEFDCVSNHPMYNFKKELRFPYYDPTLILVITLLNVNDRDTDNMEAQIIGICFFPLFISKKTRNQPETSLEEDYMLLNGDYQIPLYCQDFFQQKPFLYKNQ